MGFVSSFISGVTAAVKAGGAISALPGAATAAKVGIGVGKFAVAAAPIAKVAAIGFGAKTLLSGLTQTPQLPNVPQTAAQGLPQAPTIEQAREDTREEQLDILRRKRTGTTLTSPQGLLSLSDVSGKTLLGS